MNTSSLRATALALSSALSLAATGCSVDLGEVFSSTDNTTTSSQGGQGGGGTQGGSGGSAAGAGGGSTTSSSEGGSMTTTSTTSTTTTTTTTPTPTGGPLGCGEQIECQSPAQVCCWDKWGTGPGGFESGECQATPGDCNTTVSQGGVHTLITCQTKDDCPGEELCCGDVEQFQGGGGQTFSYYPEINCRASCNWPTRILCSGPGDASCPDGLSCKASQILPPGYFICTNN